MAKILIIDHQSSIRMWLTTSLGRSGHEVIQGTNGKSALEIASREPIDLMILDADLPGIDGRPVLSILKEDPLTRSIPVIMLTSIPSYETEAVGLRLGASNVLTKPCNFEDLAVHVRVALREGQESAKEKPRGAEVPAVPADLEHLINAASPDLEPISKSSDKHSKFISSGGGLAPLEAVLGGGLTAGELALIEGQLDCGKSLICQYLMYGTIMDGWEVTLFSSDQTAEILSQRMASIGMEVSRAVQDSTLSVRSFARPSSGENPSTLFSALASEIERLPRSCRLVLVDGITDLAILCDDRTIMGFFSTFQKLCVDGKAIVVVADSSAFDPALLGRLHKLCNTHINMTRQMVRNIPAMVLNATKVHNIEMPSDNGFSFRVEPEVGVRIIPVSRVRL